MTIQERIAKRAAQELKKGDIVNLGIGIPTMVPQFLKVEGVFLHTENGMIGVGPEDSSNIDPNLVNAGKMPISEALGAAYFNSAESFAMIRGGHVDIAILGVLQVEESGRIANWSVPGKTIIGVGGAMDLLTGAKKIICTTTHTDKAGLSKLLKTCTYPITSTRQVDLVITELAVFQFENGVMKLIEIDENSSLEEIKQKTEATFVVALKEN